MTKKWQSFKMGDLLKEVQLVLNFLGQERGDLLIQVTAEAGLTSGIL